MLSDVPLDLQLIYGLGVVAVALILWIGRLPEDDFGPQTDDNDPQNGD